MLDFKPILVYIRLIKGTEDMGMKYLAFRIDTSTIKDGKVVNGFFVRGQRNTDYNWPLLGEFKNEDSAKEYIITIRTDPVNQIVYNNGGYGISI